jgi:hypothetical protein
MQKMTPALSVVFPDVPDSRSTIHLLESAAWSARRNGLLFLESYGMGYRSPMLYEFYEVPMQLMVDGTAPEQVKQYYLDQSRYIIERMKLRFQKCLLYLQSVRALNSEDELDKVAWSMDESETKLLYRFFTKPFQYLGKFNQSILHVYDNKRPFSELKINFKDYIFNLQMFIDLCQRGILLIQDGSNPRIVKNQLYAIAGYKDWVSDYKISDSINNKTWQEVSEFLKQTQNLTLFERIISLISYDDIMLALREFTFYDIAIALTGLSENSYSSFLQQVPVLIDQMIREEMEQMNCTSPDFLQKAENNRERLIQFCQDNFPNVTNWVKKNTNDQTLP